MYCNQCGTENADDAVFCEKCGRRFGEPKEELTVVSGKGGEMIDPDDEEMIFSIRPTLLFVGSGYVLAVIGGILLAVLLGLLGVLLAHPLLSGGAVVLLCLALLLVPAYYHLKQKMIKYSLTDSKIEIDEGLISKTTRNIPLRIIQDVMVSANFLQRLLRIGNIEIENANENDSVIVLKNINSPKLRAEQILRSMRRLNR